MFLPTSPSPPRGIIFNFPCLLIQIFYPHLFKKDIYPPLAVKDLRKKPSLTCSRGLPRTKAIVQNKLPKQAEKANFNDRKNSRLAAICKADFGGGLILFGGLCFAN